MTLHNLDYGDNMETNSSLRPKQDFSLVLCSSYDSIVPKVYKVIYKNLVSGSTQASLNISAHFEASVLLFTRCIILHCFRVVALILKLQEETSDTQHVLADPLH